MNRLRVGVIGLGVMGADHARRVARRTSGARLVAIADADQGRTLALADELGARAATDPAELIDSGDVDAVLIATPGSAHEEQVMACISAGKPVLCEKPLTLDPGSSLRIIAAERAAGGDLVQVGFMRRFDREYADAKRRIAGGEIGRILLLHNVHRNKSAPARHFRTEMIVRDSLVHEVDIARFLFGEEIVEVTVLAPAATSAAARGVQDPLVALFRMAGGAIVTNEVFVGSQVGYLVRAEAVGETGSVRIGDEAAVVDDFRDRFADAYDREVRAWVDACRQGKRVGPGAWDGYAASAVSEAAVESLRIGRPMAVRLSDQDADSDRPHSAIR